MVRETSDNRRGQLLRALLASLLTLLSSRCASYVAAPLSPQERFARLDARQLDSPEVRAALGRPDPAAPWTLDDLTVAAWVLRPEIAQARADLAAVIASDAAMRAPPPLRLTLSPERFFSAVQPWVIVTQLDLLLRGAARRKIERDAAWAGQAAVRLQVAERAWEIAHHVRTSWVTWSLASRRHELLVRTTAQHRALVDLAQARVAAGRQSERDAAMMRARHTKSVAEEQHVAVDLALAQAELAHAVGLTAAQLAAELTAPPPLEPLPSPEALVRDELMQRAVFDRLDLWRTLQEYVAQEQAVRWEVAKQHPQLNLGPGYGWDRGEHKLLLGFGMELPRSLARQAGVRRAEAERSVVAARFDRLQAEARAAVDGAISALGAAWPLRGRLGEARQSALAALERERSVVAAGAGDRAALIELEIAACEAERAELDGEQLAAEALLQLEAAVQRPVWPVSRLDRSPPAVTAASAEVTAPR